MVEDFVKRVFAANSFLSGFFIFHLGWKNREHHCLIFFPSLVDCVAYFALKGLSVFPYEFQRR